MYKLVRDNIPELINAQDGQVADFAEIKNDQFYLKALNSKLIEECNEYLASGNIEELVDVVTVIDYIVAARGMSKEDFKKVYDNKLNNLGGFSNRYLLFIPDTAAKQNK